MQTQLFDSLTLPAHQTICDGAVLLRGYSRPSDDEILTCIRDITVAAPFRHLQTPGGFQMAVAMTSCGSYGWFSDHNGYRYVTHDPSTGLQWPAMPLPLLGLARAAADAAGFREFAPDSCLINRYLTGTKLSLHQDKDESDFAAPIVSVSLGVPATFLFGGAKRNDPCQRIVLTHGDIVVWGGPARRFYHGVLPIKPAHHPFAGDARINLTFRKAR
jgi:alkylated DNA repair protein (DNA oxidative demethylase)